VSAPAGGAAEDGAASAPKAGSAAARPRRRVPVWVFGAGGALAALGFGVGVEKMHLGPPLVMIALGGMTLALTGAALWRVIDPLTREAGPEPRAPREARRNRELEREKQLVLKAIKEIELDYQMRKIAEADYREMVERYRARALRLIGEIEAGDDFRGLIERELAIRLKLPQAQVAKPAAAVKIDGNVVAPASAADAGPATPSRAFCAGCKTLNDEDAEFCKKCGRKL
jgi:hypothetical protein